MARRCPAGSTAKDTAFGRAKLRRSSPAAVHSRKQPPPDASASLRGTSLGVEARRKRSRVTTRVPIRATFKPWAPSWPGFETRDRTTRNAGGRVEGLGGGALWVARARGGSTLALTEAVGDALGRPGLERSRPKLPAARIPRTRIPRTRIPATQGRERDAGTASRAALSAASNSFALGKRWLGSPAIARWQTAASSLETPSASRRGSGLGSSWRRTISSGSEPAGWGCCPVRTSNRITPRE